jgi:hypothetical protein
MSRAENAGLRAKIAHCPRDLRKEFQECMRQFKLARPEANAWDDDKVIEEMLLILSREENPIVTPIGRDSNGRIIFRSNRYRSKLQRAIRWFLTFLPIEWRWIGGGR